MNRMVMATSFAAITASSGASAKSHPFVSHPKALRMTRQHESATSWFIIFLILFSIAVVLGVGIVGVSALQPLLGLVDCVHFCVCHPVIQVSLLKERDLYHRMRSRTQMFMRGPFGTLSFR